MDTQRVTVRGINREAIDRVRETAAFNGITLGEAVTEALFFWLDSLEEADNAEAWEGVAMTLSGLPPSAPRC